MRLYRFSLDEFLTLENQWQDLLNRSNANKLFLSWHWMYSWWEVYGKLDNDSLLLLGIYDDNNNLICLAPFYSSIYKIKNKFPIKIIQFIGTRVGGFDGFRTEYIECIIDSKATDSVIEKILNYLVYEVGFDELCLTDLLVNSETYRAVQKLKSNNNFYKRLQSEDQSYGIDVEASFQDFVRTLGKNTRLKTYNRRKVLNSIGDITIESVDSHNYQDVLEKLSDFHLHRWEEKISYAMHGEFLFRLLADSSIEICGIIVRLNNDIIGCTLDMCLGDRVYNFQSGYKEGIDKKIAVGSLTIGYAIEHYCKRVDHKYYDLLAGEGKKSNYKSRIAKPELNVENFRLILPTWLRYMYQIKDKLNLL